jgi:hypothetical protein
VAVFVRRTVGGANHGCRKKITTVCRRAATESRKRVNGILGRDLEAYRNWHRISCRQRDTNDDTIHTASSRAAAAPTPQIRIRSDRFALGELPLLETFRFVSVNRLYLWICFHEGSQLFQADVAARRSLVIPTSRCNFGFERPAKMDDNGGLNGSYGKITRMRKHIRPVCICGRRNLLRHEFESTKAPSHQVSSHYYKSQDQDCSRVSNCPARAHVGIQASNQCFSVISGS